MLALLDDRCPAHRCLPPFANPSERMHKVAALPPSAHCAPSCPTPPSRPYMHLPGAQGPVHSIANQCCTGDFLRHAARTLCRPASALRHAERRRCLALGAEHRLLVIGCSLREFPPHVLQTLLQHLDSPALGSIGVPACLQLMSHHRLHPRIKCQCQPRTGPTIAFEIRPRTHSTQALHACHSGHTPRRARAAQDGTEQEATHTDCHSARLGRGCPHIPRGSLGGRRGTSCVDRSFLLTS